MRMVKCYKKKNLDSYYLEMVAIIYEFNWKQYVSSTTYIKLEQENKKLKDDLLSYIRRDEDLREQNKKLSEENGQLKKDNEYRKKIVDIIPQDEKSVAEETIKDLQERIRFLEQCLDNKEKVNKSLREENKRLSDYES